MYSDHFGFSEKPFALTPNSRFMYLGHNHKEAFAHLLYGINNRHGFMCLVGEVGTGKTTILRALLGTLQEQQYSTALIFNPCLTAMELIQSINREFGLTSDSDHSSELLNTLNNYLLSENSHGRTVVLAIDEAQNLKPGVLEEICLISNMETENSKLIQIILAGQPELTTLLNKTELRQLDQRIAVRYTLNSLNRAETGTYIRHRIEIAGNDGSVSFSNSAVRLIHLYARGIPRVINILCDRALLDAYSRDRLHISAGTVFRAIWDLRKLHTLGKAREYRPATAAMKRTPEHSPGRKAPATGKADILAQADPATGEAAILAQADPATGEADILAQADLATGEAAILAQADSALPAIPEEPESQPLNNEPWTPTHFDLGEELRLELDDVIPAGYESDSERGLSLHSMIKKLNDPKLQAGVLLLLLRFAAEFFNRSIVFMINDTTISGVGQFGIESDTISGDDKVRTINSSLESGSLFHTAYSTARASTFKPELTTDNRQIFDQLGGGIPDELFIGPIVSRSGVIGFLYGDNLPGTTRIGRTETLEIFLSQAGVVLEKIMLEQQLQTSEQSTLPAAVQKVKP